MIENDLKTPGREQNQAQRAPKDGSQTPGTCLSPSAAFVHRSVLAEEAPRAVAGAVPEGAAGADGVYVDATFGRGGHSRRLLALLSPAARLYAFDRDAQAVAAAASIDDPRFEIIHAPFSAMARELAKRGVFHVDGVLMDIGVSSPQIDDPARGFSFRFDGPLDMRMDTSCGMTAAEWLAKADAAEIEFVLREYGEERFARSIARAIVKERASRPFTRTRQLADFVAHCVGRSAKDAGQHPATRTFQAIRIRINGELDELKSALNEAGALLNEGGRLVVISFHSLEDRIVKRFFEMGAHPERAIDARIALKASDLPAPLWQSCTRVRAGKAECEANPRARSAVMRCALRTARSWPESAETCDLAGGAP